MNPFRYYAHAMSSEERASNRNWAYYKLLEIKDRYDAGHATWSDWYGWQQMYKMFDREARE